MAHAVNIEKALKYYDEINEVLRDVEETHGRLAFLGDLEFLLTASPEELDKTIEKLGSTKGPLSSLYSLRLDADDVAAFLMAALLTYITQALREDILETYLIEAISRMRIVATKVWA